MELTPELKKILVEGLQQHDFTKDISLVLPGEGDAARKKLLKFSSPLVSRIKDYMKNNLADLGIKRHMDNFSPDHPVNFLMDVDARYIASESAKILSDEEQTAAAVEKYFDMFGPLLETAVPAYCRDKGKSQDELTDEDIRIIMDRVTSVVNEELTSVLMQGQQLPELYEISHGMQTHEDFPEKFNMDAINFHNQWMHCKTQVGALLEYDDENTAGPSHNDDPVGQMMYGEFCAMLNDRDLTILRMREDGYTLAEIAEKLGYNTHSAVLKRLRSMQERWSEYMDEIKPE